MVARFGGRGGIYNAVIRSQSVRERELEGVRRVGEAWIK